ncbi:MAG: hypothetical protein DRJ45_09435 [Thermoprotei archaeon]|nr:MAG: hypothetical protein DRJ45_09435 [Thermoprotei archaeon]
MALDPAHPNSVHNLDLGHSLHQPKPRRDQPTQEGRDSRRIIRGLPKPDLHKFGGEDLGERRFHGRHLWPGECEPEPPQGASLEGLWPRDLQGSRR